MGFSKALWNEIANNIGALHPVKYATQPGTSPPYYVMLPLPGDTEQPETVCQTQGRQGRITIQFSASAQVGAGGTEDLLIDLKDKVGAILGNITYNAEEYTVWKNETGGVSSLAGADANTWDAIFTSTFWWERIA